VQLADGGTVPWIAVLGDRGHPSIRRNRKHGITNRLGEVEADGEEDAAFTQGIEEVVGGAGGVRAGQHRRIVLSPRRELLERGVEDPDVIAGMVGAGIAGTQQPGQDLVGLVQAAEQRMEAEAALVRPGGALLLRVGGDQGGVEVEGDVLGADAVSPGVGACLGPGLANRDEVEVGGERVDHPPGGGDRGHLPEEVRLVVQDGQVGEAVAAIGDAHGEVAQHLAGVMRTPTPLQARELPG